MDHHVEVQAQSKHLTCKMDGVHYQGSYWVCIIKDHTGCALSRDSLPHHPGFKKGGGGGFQQYINYIHSSTGLSCVIASYWTVVMSYGLPLGLLWKCYINLYGLMLGNVIWAYVRFYVVFGK